jgi:Transmembrane secretion effector
MPPLIARDQVAGGPKLYGILLGAIGVGAVAGAFGLPRLTRDLGADRMVALGTAGAVIALLLFALARHWTIALVGSLIAGMSWIMVLATTNVSAQVALPGWTRSRIVDFRHRNVRFPGRRQRDLGPGRRAAGGSYSRGPWRYDCGPPAVALEAPDWRGSRPHAINPCTGRRLSFPVTSMPIEGQCW